MYRHKSSSSIAPFRLHAAVLANQNIRIDILREKREEWPPYLAHKLKPNNRAKDWWTPDKTVKKSNGPR